MSYNVSIGKWHVYYINTLIILNERIIKDYIEAFEPKLSELTPYSAFPNSKNFPKF